MPSTRPRTKVPSLRAGSLIDSIDWWQRLTMAGVVTVAVSLTALLVAHNSHYTPQVQDAVHAARVVNGSHVAMLDQQSGLRAYVLTGDDHFLEAFRVGRAELESLDQETVDVPQDLRDLVMERRLAQSAWADRWVEDALAFGASNSGDIEAGEHLLREGKALFDEYRLDHDALVDALVDARDTAIAGQARAVSRTVRLTLAVAAATLLASTWHGARLRRRVHGALDSIDERLTRVRSGDLEPGPLPWGHTELAAIQAGIDAAAAELAETRAASAEHEAHLVSRTNQLGQVLRFAREVAGSLNMRYVLRGLCDAAADITGAGHVVVWIRSEDGKKLEAVADSAGPGLEPVGLDPVAFGEGPLGNAVRFGRVHGTDAGGDVVAVPMVVGAEVIGVLQIEYGTWVDSTLSVVEALAVQAATAVGAARIHQHTTELAMVDALTGLANRRQLEVDLASEIEVAARYDRPLAFAMVDVDRFKSYNDTYGHQAGDVALQQLAKVLDGAVRSGDRVYRYGGEELAIVMRESDVITAGMLVERCRAAVEHHFSAPGQRRAVTISVGIADFPAHATTTAELVAAADAALYEAKGAGRNRICAAGTGVHSTAGEADQGHLET